MIIYIIIRPIIWSNYWSNYKTKGGESVYCGDTMGSKNCKEAGVAADGQKECFSDPPETRIKDIMGYVEMCFQLSGPLRLAACGFDPGRVKPKTYYYS